MNTGAFGIRLYLSRESVSRLLTVLCSLLFAACSKHGNFERNIPSNQGIVPTSPAMVSSQLKANSTISISWTIKDAVFRNSLVVFEMSTNAGTSWFELERVDSDLRQYTAQLPDIESDQVRIRAYYLDKSGTKHYFYETPALAIDVNPPILTLNSFDSFGVYKGGSVKNISWTAKDLSFDTKPVSLLYSADHGASWQPIASGQPAIGSYAWTLPAINSSEVLVKVIAQDVHGRSTSVISGKAFTIDSASPSLTLLSPKEGEIWNGLSDSTLNWVSSDSHPRDHSVTIEFSNDGGASFLVLFNEIKNTGSQVISSSDLASMLDSVNCLVRITVKDQAGNHSTVVSSPFQLSRTHPQLTLQQKRINYGKSDLYTFSGTCERSAKMSEHPGVVVTPASAPLLPTTVPCNGVSDIGTWSFTANQTTDNSYEYTFSQTNDAIHGAAKMAITATWIRDTVAPSLTSFKIDNAAEFATSPFVTLDLSATDNNDYPLQVALQEAATEEADCLFDKAENFQLASQTASAPFSLRMSDGTKKICAQVSDQAGNISIMNLSTGDLGVNADIIRYEGNSPPVVEAFTVINPTDGSLSFKAGDSVHITWTVSDSSGLSASPISLEYTLDGAEWIPLIKNHGSLSSGAKSYTDKYTHFTAPSSYFMVRISAQDLAGNKSFRVNSAPLNAPQWSIFAGSLDNGVGGTPRTMSFQNVTSTSQSIAVHPLTGDIYTVSAMGVVKFNPTTGASDLIFSSDGSLTSWSESGLSDTGGTYSNVRLYLNFLSISFDNNGLLYVNASLPSDRSNARVYQIDLENKKSRHYAGGGTHLDAKQLDGITSLDLATHLGPIPLDEDNALYMNVPCSTVGDSSEYRRQLVKIPQLSDGTPGAPVHIAGNCGTGAGANNTLATETPFSYGVYYLYSSLIVRDRGQKIYLAPYNGAVFKIIKGRHYTTSITASAPRGIVWSHTDNHLYVVHNSAAHDLIHKWANPGLAQAGGETSAGVVLSYKGTSGDCWEDDILATSACAYFDLAMTQDRNNNIFFLDGLRINTTGSYRVRFVDPTGRVQTIAGTKPFFGKDMDKMLFRATGLGSIVYKTSTEVDSVWSPGLYFADKVGQVLGYIGNDNKTKILWGNQVNGTSNYIPTGTPISPNIPMGYRYTDNGGIVTFNSAGLPWMKVSNRILSIDKDGKVVARQTGATSNMWHSTTTPSTSAMHVNGLRQNMAMKKENIVFLMGRYSSPPTIATDAPKISAFNFTTDTVLNILGPVGGPTPAPDQIALTDLSTFNLSSICVNSYCALQFLENDETTETDDELFFLEGMKIRKITNPMNPGAQTLTTVLSLSPDLITIPWGTSGEYNQVANFFVTPDRARIFYVSENKLYCSMINNEISSWCNGQELGPFAGAGDIPKVSGQFTMLDSDSLLISTGRVILRFDFPTD